MIETLYKKAKGYDVEEVNREYAVDEEGNKRLIKEKTSVKHIPPDLSALKAYMDIRDTELTKMSTQELEQEKMRLLKELKILERNNKKNDSKKRN